MAMNAKWQKFKWSETIREWKIRRDLWSHGVSGCSRGEDANQHSRPSIPLAFCDSNPTEMRQRKMVA